MNERRGNPGDAGASQSAPRDWRRLHLWQIQPVRDALLLLAVFGLVSLGYAISIVTVPLLLAMALAYLFEPLVRAVTKSRWVSRQGVALSIIALAIVVIVVPVFFGVGFAVLQGISYTRAVVTHVQALQRSVERPEDDALRDSLPDGAWRRIRDYIVAARAEEKEAANDPAGTRDDPSVPEGTEANPPDPEVEPMYDGSFAIHDQARDLVRETTSWLFHLLQANTESIGKFVGRQAVGSGADAARAALRLVTGTGYLMFTGFLTAFFFFFFCTGYGRLLKFWEDLIPERRKARVFDLLGQMDAVIAAFIRGRLTVCAALMVFYTVGYWLVGVPAPLILGPIVGLLALLPYVAGLGMPVAMLLMWLQPSAAGWQSEWWWIVGAPILVTIGAQILDDYILTPIIQGKRTGMDTPSIVFASIAGGALAGVYGLLLAIPAAACIKILLKEVVAPRFRDWAAGRTNDPLPIDPSDTLR